MPGKKSLPKDRYERQRKSRETRRILAAITPETSHLQTQSPLFSILPGEIRSLIFRLVLSEKHDPDLPIDVHTILYRPGHTHFTTFDLSLLRTCRLVYYESRAIPLRSATHHFGCNGKVPWSYQIDSWVYHIIKQRGPDLYHLHDHLATVCLENFSRFLLLHLHWRRITWTVYSYPFSPTPTEQSDLDCLAYTLTGLTLPASCQEVTLEMEWREDLLSDWDGIKGLARACQEIALARSDGSQLEFDREYALQYKWICCDEPQSPGYEDEEPDHLKGYHTIRLCWRAKVVRREYMSYDHLDCLRVDGCPGVLEILPYDYGL